MAIPNDPTALGLVGTLALALGAALVKWGPALFRVANGSGDAKRKVLHDKIAKVSDDLNEHRIEDKGIHAELGTNLKNLTEKVDDLKDATVTGTHDIMELLREQRRG